VSDTPPKRLPLRWLTLAEIVGVAALVIAGLGYWDSHRQHLDEEKAQAAAERDHQAEVRAGARKPAFLMTGSVNKDGDVVRLASVHAEQVIQTQTVWFPSPVAKDSVETTGNPRVEAGWVAGGLAKAAGHIRRGRVPVGVFTTYIEDGETKSDSAIYMLGYSLNKRMLLGDKVTLEGLSLARRGVSGDLHTAVDGLWAAQ
jgi:hypothetical protein